MSMYIQPNINQQGLEALILANIYRGAILFLNGGYVEYIHVHDPVYEYCCHGLTMKCRFDIFCVIINEI